MFVYIDENPLSLLSSGMDSIHQCWSCSSPRTGLCILPIECQEVSAGPFLQPAGPSGWICGCLVCQLLLPVWCHLSLAEDVLCNLHIANAHPAFSSPYACHCCLFTDCEHNLKVQNPSNCFQRTDDQEKAPHVQIRHPAEKS